MDKNLIEYTGEYLVFDISDEKENAISGFRCFDIKGDYKSTQFLHHHNFWELFIIEEGSGTHYLDFNQFPIKKNHAFCIRRGQRCFVKNLQPSKAYPQSLDFLFVRFLVPLKFLIKKYEY